MICHQQLDINVPDFIVVGAAKSGTTFLHDVLASHPQVFMPEIKETWFFHLVDNPNKSILRRNPRVPDTWLKYLSLFEAAPSDVVCGEATPSYLYYYNLAIRNMFKYLPCAEKLKIIIILREPISKVWSHYRFVHTRNIDPERLDFPESLKQEESRKGRLDLLPDVLYVSNTLYSDAVEAYQKAFANVRIYLYDDLLDDSQALVRDVCEYIGVEPELLPALPRTPSNSSQPRYVLRKNFASKALSRGEYIWRRFAPAALCGMRERACYTEERLAEPELRLLADQFRSDVERLQGLIGRDLSSWIHRYDKIAKEGRL